MFHRVETGRLRLDLVLTASRTAGAKPGAKKILIYDASPHPLSDLNPAKCGMGTAPRERHQWAITMLKQLEQLLDAERADTENGAYEDMATGEHQVS
jgi:hypothetical protein